MVDRQTILETLALLKATYPMSLKDLSSEETKAMVNVWLYDFQNISKEVFLKAINDIRYTKSFFPSIAEIKQKIAEIETDGLPKAEDEWEEVLKKVRKFGSYREQEALESMNSYTAYIVRHIGFMNICMAADQTWNKKEFIAEYNELKDKDIESLQTGDIGGLKMIDLKKELDYDNRTYPIREK